MKKLSLTVLAFSVFAAGSAFAADLPLPVKALPLPVDLWTGWYVGGNLGVSFGTLNETTTRGPTDILFTQQSTPFNGVVGGVQGGYNWHMNPSWLFGLETDFQGTSERASISESQVLTTTVFNALATTNAAVLPVTAALTDTESLLWFGTARARVGWTPNPGALLYATGGLAYGGINSSDVLTLGKLTPVNASFNTVRVGWTAGGGVEVFVAPNWTAKVEYLYIDFGSFTNTFAGLATFNPIMVSTHITDQIVRVGVNYHFY
jgi:outer membrane immunogenic protein